MVRQDQAPASNWLRSRAAFHAAQAGFIAWLEANPAPSQRLRGEIDFDAPDPEEIWMDRFEVAVQPFSNATEQLLDTSEPGLDIIAIKLHILRWRLARDDNDGADYNEVAGQIERDLQLTAKGASQTLTMPLYVHPDAGPVFPDPGGGA